MLDAILESTCDGILAIDAPGRVQHANSRFLQMWQIPPDMLARRNDDELLRYATSQLRDPEAFVTRVRQLYGSGEQDFDTIEFLDGRVFERNSLPLTRNGQVVGRVWSFRDITERRAAEQERRRLRERLVHAQKMESLGVLAGGIAHDFNNTLMTIIGNAELAMLDLPISSPVRLSLSEVDRAARKAADLTRQMLAYSGKGQFLTKPIDLSAFVAESLPLLESCCSANISLQTTLASDLPMISADPEQLSQILVNLVANAAEAYESDSDQTNVVMLVTGMEHLNRERFQRSVPEALVGRDEKELADGQFVFLEVIDQGSGMDEATRHKAFEPFFTARFAGRGLGLPAVLGIVRGHAGTIEIDSEPGRGTRLRILLPVRGCDEEDTVAEEAASAAGKLVLVVDDEEQVRSLVCRMVERLGYEVVAAPGGRAALEALRGAATRFSLVILDLSMPEMDGVETFRHLRQLDPDMPVLLCSGYSEQDLTRRFARKGFAGFIQKPCRLRVLADKIEAALSQAS